MSRYAITLAAVAVGILGSDRPGSAQDNKDDPLKADAVALQGKWERGTISSPSPAGLKMVKEVSGDKETVTYYGKDGQVVRSHRVTFKLSDRGSVRVYSWSDMEVLAGPFKGRKSKEGGSYIYRLDGDEMFEVGGLLTDTKYAQDVPYLARWKKVVKAEPQPAVAVEGDLKLVQGDWDYTAQEVDGVRVPADFLKALTVTIDTDRFAVKSGKDVVQEGKVTFDPNQTPKAADVKVTGGQTKGSVWLGIYKLDGDTLTMCFDPNGKKRPTEFQAKEGSGNFVGVFTRRKK